MKENDKKILQRYIEIAEFLSKCLGNNTEIAVHDLTNVDRSLIAIHNNEISGRSVGAPATDFALNVIKGELHKKKPYMVNYKGLANDAKDIKSSTFLIKNDKEELIGMLCLNTDITKYMQVIETFNQLVGMPCKEKVKQEEEQISEVFPSSINEIVEICIKEVMGDEPIPVKRLTAGEKTNIIRKLNEKGFFLLKTGISVAAEELQMSEPSIYRYLSKLKREEN